MQTLHYILGHMVNLIRFLQGHNKKANVSNLYTQAAYFFLRLDIYFPCLHFNTHKSY